MLLSFGNGGWLRVDAADMPGAMYLRYRIEKDRAVLAEFYLDAHAGEIPSDLFAKREPEEALDLKGMYLLVNEPENFEWLSQSVREPGPDLSRLASYYGTTFGSARHWVAESMRAQIQGSDATQPEVQVLEATEPRQPDPVRAPKNGLDDEFLRGVAASYVWNVRNRIAPAPAISKSSGNSVKTAQSWIAKARKRGFLPRTTQGRRG